jgi:hypothetical protein
MGPAEIIGWGDPQAWSPRFLWETGGLRQGPRHFYDCRAKRRFSNAASADRGGTIAAARRDPSTKAITFQFLSQSPRHQAAGPRPLPLVSVPLPWAAHDPPCSLGTLGLVPLTFPTFRPPIPSCPAVILWLSLDAETRASPTGCRSRPGRRCVADLTHLILMTMPARDLATLASIPSATSSQPTIPLGVLRT